MNGFPAHDPRLKLSESYIESTVTHYAVGRGWLSRKLQWIGRNGAPDRFYVRKGKVIFVEFKATGKFPRPDQRLEHERLRGQGMEVHVIDNLQDGYDLFA